MSDRSALGAFLRSRRERLSPHEVGLPPGGRRRTPGLRREEVAMLAGISVDYLVRLEQGRESRPSAAVLAALSNALRLKEDERSHLASLVAADTQTEMCPTTPAPSTLPATTLALLEHLHPAPGFVLAPSAEVLAWNPAYDRLMHATGLFDLQPPNLARYTFLAPAARSLYRDWTALARERVASLRAATTHCPIDPAVERLVGELSVSSPEFARLWARHEVGENHRGIHRLAHPLAGEIDLAFEAMILADSQRRLITYLPANDASASALDRLVANEPPGARAAHLRVVQGHSA